jgi:gas vesicle protein
MKSTQKILTAAVAGAVIGAVAGILLAPDKGTETRKKIADQSRKVGDSLKDAIESGKSTLSEMKEKYLSGKNGNSFSQATADNR